MQSVAVEGTAEQQSPFLFHQDVFVEVAKQFVVEFLGEVVRILLQNIVGRGRLLRSEPHQQCQAVGMRAAPVTTAQTGKQVSALVTV